MLGCVALLAAAPVSAQTGTDGAWSGMMLTPVGALPALELPSGGTVDRRTQFAVRLASWKDEGATDRNTTYGLTMFSAMGEKARFGTTVAYLQPSGDDDATLMIGGDLGMPVWVSAQTDPTAVSIDVKGSVGYGHFLGDASVNTWSVVGQVPIKIRHELANRSMLSGFVGLGFGFAGMSVEGLTDNGTRPMISAGGAWTSAGGIGIHLGGQQVILDSDPAPPWVWSLSGTFPMGTRR